MTAIAEFHRFAAEGPTDDRAYLTALCAVRKADKALAYGELPPLQQSGVAYLRSLLAAGLKAYEIRKGDHLRRGRWSQTHFGRRFWPEDPRPEECDIRDIAYGLSRTPRFYGATVGLPYSVAQHCVLGSYFCGRHALAFLLHDASEAYVGDVASHIKKVIGHQYADIEEGIMDAVVDAFGVFWTDKTDAAVDEIDARMLATEVEQLVDYGVINQESMAKPLPIDIDPWPSELAEGAFLSRFRELTTDGQEPVRNFGLRESIWGRFRNGSSVGS